jgi:hypothetical protein
MATERFYNQLDGAGAYTLDAITTAGNAYAAADTLVILGTDLGGSSPANDATITVTSVTAGNITGGLKSKLRSYI